MIRLGGVERLSFGVLDDDAPLGGHDAADAPLAFFAVIAAALALRSDRQP